MSFVLGDETYPSDEFLEKFWNHLERLCEVAKAEKISEGAGFTHKMYELTQADPGAGKYCGHRVAEMSAFKTFLKKTLDSLVLCNKIFWQPFKDSIPHQSNSTSLNQGFSLGSSLNPNSGSENSALFDGLSVVNPGSSGQMQI